MAFLPDSQGGLLPYFLLYTSLSALLHSAICYLRPAPTTMTMFTTGPSTSTSSSSPPPTPLLAHTYAVKNFYTGLIRLYAAYHIADPKLYDLAIATYVGVVWLYGTETFKYKTVGFEKGGSLIPLVQAGGGVVWMVLQRGGYVVG
ncbi:hypothetical protein GE09DRAFT_1218625 [Coniochaeta sp. 2T2.1]|nr:hypothetical protein GE09DRAFT_1218625 [Coniochaeta sp. 2T2.1]